MLRDLHIRNLAVVAEAAIELGPGLNVLTGETGAGKSIVVDSLALLAGGRASAELIRTGADTLTVTGVFEPRDETWRQRLEEAGVTAGDELVVRREVSRAGRNRVFVNDQPVTLALLAELAAPLIRIHGQREELGLTAPDLQRAWLDRRGGAEAEELLATAGRAFAEHQRLADRLAEVRGDDRARRERLDFLRFQLAEIEAAEPVAEEEVGLREERQVLRHAEAIRQALAGAGEALFEQGDSAYETLGRALHHLEGISDWEPRAAEWTKELDELRIRAGELETALRRRLEEVDSDPDRLDAVEERLATLERLFRKYGDDSTVVIARRDALAAELAELTADEEGQDELEAKVQKALAVFREAAGALSEARRGWGEKLAEGVRAELADLALAKARFAVRLDRRRRAGSGLVVDGVEVEFGPHGFDQVVFELSPNPGEALRPLAKIASGGELSRLYLAVQLAARGGREAVAGGATLVFDEVDSGIGGAEAAALGGKLRRLARGGQILAVTHLPQVASCADLHFKVGKVVERGRTLTAVERLSEDGRAGEVARMLAGAEPTELSLRHARELIAEASA